MKLTIGLLLGLSLFVCNACGQTVFERTDRQKEIELGRAYMDEMARVGLVSRNDSYIRRVKRLIAQLKAVYADRAYPFEVVVTAETVVNAFCGPGGFIVVTEGLLAIMPQDEQLASVLAHEMGHAVRRHWARLWRAQQANVIGDILGTVLTNGRYIAPDRTLTYLSYQRSYETEADDFGTELYLRAGYKTEDMASAMETLLSWERKHGAGHDPEYLQTHPALSKRIASIQSLGARLLAAGLKPVEFGSTVDVSLTSIFGELPTIAAQGNPYCPTEPGTIWTYSVRSPSGNSSYRIRAVGLADVLTSKVARMEMTAGERVVAYQLMADGSRVYRRNRPEQTSSKWTIETAFPETDGLAESAGDKFKFIARETVETPAGKFEDCLALAVEDHQGRKFKVWYAAGKGLVKRVNEATGIEEVLTAFRKT